MPTQALLWTSHLPASLDIQVVQFASREQPVPLCNPGVEGMGEWWEGEKGALLAWLWMATLHCHDSVMGQVQHSRPTDAMVREQETSPLSFEPLGPLAGAVSAAGAGAG